MVKHDPQAWDAMYEAAGVAKAKHISVGHCTNEECACGNVFVQLLDEGQEIFAVAPFSPAVAVELAGQLLEAAETLTERTRRLTAN